MTVPSIISTEALTKENGSYAGNTVELDGKWVMARPCCYDRGPILNLITRIRLASLVFTGKCDVLKWGGNQ